MDTADMERIVSLSGGSGCATDQVPVSYTHRDVYKRQGQGLPYILQTLHPVQG